MHIKDPLILNALRGESAGIPCQKAINWTISRYFRRKPGMEGNTDLHQFNAYEIAVEGKRSMDMQRLLRQNGHYVWMILIF